MSPLGRDDNHSVRSPVSVDCDCGGILENRDVLYLFCSDERRRSLDTVNYVHHIVAREGAPSPDKHCLSVVRKISSACHIHSGKHSGYACKCLSSTGNLKGLYPYAGSADC